MTKKEAIVVLEQEQAFLMGKGTSLPIRHKYEDALNVAITTLWEQTKLVDFGQFKTNADRIRSMTDEELATTLAVLTKYDICVNPSAVTCEHCPFCAFCTDCIEGDELVWLKQPYKKDENG